MFTYKSASLILTSWDNRHATLHDFYAQYPGQGHGAKLLKKVVRLCDKRKLTVILEANSSYPERMSNKKLAKWYGRFGFKIIERGETIWMRRLPQ